MANAFEVKTMKGSRLTARIAGTESTANTTSVLSIRIRTANSGVANRFPDLLGEELLTVVFRGHRENLADDSQHRVLLGVDLRLLMAGDPKAVKIRNAPKM